MPESEDNHRSRPLELTSWYWPVLEVPSFRGFARPVLADSHAAGAYDPPEKFVFVLPALEPSVTIDELSPNDVALMVDAVNVDTLRSDK